MAEPRLTELYVGLPAAELVQTLAAHPHTAHQPVRTVYMGGGTPALLGADGLRRLAETINKILPLDALEEWTIELNPATVNAPLLEALRAVGVNRVSLGVQSFNDETLARIGRRHNAKTALQAIRLVQDAGFKNAGIDLIAGLPGVSADEWQQTLDRALSLNLVHLSVYALTLEPKPVMWRQAAAAASAFRHDLSSRRSAKPSARSPGGFERYEISTYAFRASKAPNLGLARQRLHRARAGGRFAHRPPTLDQRRGSGRLH